MKMFVMKGFDFAGRRIERGSLVTLDDPGLVLALAYGNRAMAVDEEAAAVLRERCVCSPTPTEAVE